MLPPLAQFTATNARSDGTTASPLPPAGNGNLEAASKPGSLVSGDAKTQSATPDSPMGKFMFPVIILMFVVLYFVMFRGQRKDEKKRKAMITEMKKGDRVMTIGGLVARVVSIDGEEVVLKIDESANVKATYTKSSIQRVLGNEEKK